MDMQISNENDRVKIAKAVQKSYSMRSTLQALEMVPAGANYEVLRNWIKQLKLDTSHWSSIKRTYVNRKVRSIEEILIDGIWLTTSRTKKRLIKAGLLKEICADCGLGPEWNNKYLVLHLDHKNGKRDDYRLENLRLLCPNCHSQTDTYAGKNKNATREPYSTGQYGPIQEKAIKIKKERKPKQIKYCIVCNKETSTRSQKYCSQECLHKSQNRVERPTKEQLEKLIQEKSLSEIGRGFGLSPNTIKKWCESYNIQPPGVGYWAKVYAGKIKLTSEIKSSIN